MRSTSDCKGGISAAGSSVRARNGSLGTPCVSSLEVCVNLGQATAFFASGRKVTYLACYIWGLINGTPVTNHVGQVTQPPIRMHSTAVLKNDSRICSFELRPGDWRPLSKRIIRFACLMVSLDLGTAFVQRLCWDLQWLSPICISLHFFLLLWTAPLASLKTSGPVGLGIYWAERRGIRWSSTDRAAYCRPGKKKKNMVKYPDLGLLIASDA